MTVLPHDIKVMFYKVFEDDISLDDFEEWLYNNNELENYLNPDDYFDLISMNFKKKGSKDELRDLLKKHFAPGEFETLKMLRLLNEAKLKTERLPSILMEFYELYCQGYSFLEDLGLGIGFAVEVPRLTNTTFDTWDELTREQQRAFR